MARKNKIEDINLKLRDVELVKNENYQGIYFSWESGIGFGEYTIYKGKDGIWKADSETMDCNTDRDFITELMKQFIESLVIH